ncbi:hypothetical protein DIPPA_16073 [Diplonema papillatum]|nr:hypothetical protein DIPPA_16073 [Diplonema papillatum]
MLRRSMALLSSARPACADTSRKKGVYRSDPGLARLSYGERLERFFARGCALLAVLEARNPRTALQVLEEVTQAERKLVFVEVLDVVNSSIQETCATQLVGVLDSIVTVCETYGHELGSRARALIVQVCANKVGTSRLLTRVLKRAEEEGRAMSSAAVLQVLSSCTADRNLAGALSIAQVRYLPMPAQAQAARYLMATANAAGDPDRALSIFDDVVAAQGEISDGLVAALITALSLSSNPDTLRDTLQNLETGNVAAWLGPVSFGPLAYQVLIETTCPTYAAAAEVATRMQSAGVPINTKASFILIKRALEEDDFPTAMHWYEHATAQAPPSPKVLTLIAQHACSRSSSPDDEYMHLAESCWDVAQAEVLRGAPLSKKEEQLAIGICTALHALYRRLDMQNDVDAIDQVLPQWLRRKHRVALDAPAHM